jgi:uncharacterized protein YfdQ (DUF2303 family)
LHGGGGHFGRDGIYYSSSADSSKGSFNESMSVVDDGYTLQLKPMGMYHAFGAKKDQQLTFEGAAEYFWDMLIRTIQ